MGRLLYVLKRKGLKKYTFETLEWLLRLRNEEELQELLSFFNAMNIKNVGIVAEDEALGLLGELLEGHIGVHIYKSYHEAFDEVEHKGLDLIIAHDGEFNQVAETKFGKKPILLDCEILQTILGSKDLEGRLRVLMNTLFELGKVMEEVLIFRIPTVHEIKNPSNAEIRQKDWIKLTDAIVIGMDMDEESKCEYIKEVTTTKNQLIGKGNKLYWTDLKGEYVNFINGRRITTDDVGGYQNKIYVIGDSLAMGSGNEDKNTIASFMQRFLNGSEKPYKIVNCGIGSRISIYKVMDEIKKGDKVAIIIGGYYSRTIIPFITSKLANARYHPLNHLFDRPHDMGEIYWDGQHVNYIANEKVAREIIDVMKKQPETGVAKCDGTDVLETQGDTDEQLMQQGLRQYLDSLTRYRPRPSTRDVGAIVMNCNPFTYGHRHLIEYASERVGHLILFVVEEDKSYFRFKDRLAMVKDGTKDIPNVTVIPSGSFIISTVTFKEYFDKDSLQGAAIDPTMDVEIFAKHIAPVLHITKRFVGEEPNCYVTNQYNQAMREVLPRYGVEFIEIPRKESGGQAISASVVRRLIEEKDVRGIKELVPPSTFEFLASSFHLT